MLVLLIAQTVSVDTITVEPTHSPMKAAVLSLLLPGGGQFYNRQYLKGLLIGGGELFLYSTLYYSIKNYRETEQENYFWMGTSAMVGIVWLKLFSITDAYIDAQFIIANERIERLEIKVLKNF